MTFKLTFLGTSASVPSAERNHPSLLIESGGQRILVDCGEGTQRQLLRARAGFRRLDRLLLTHAHFDHVLGIPGLFSTLRLRQSEELVSVHGSRETLDVVARMLAGLWGEGRAPISLDLVPLTPGLVVDADEFRIDCFQVRHRDTDSYGFVFETPPRRHLRPDRLAALGVPDGPIRKELAEGRSIIIGDTETTDGLREQVRGADLLVIEATFLQRDSGMAREYGHLTAAEAASVAANNHVKQLVLTHISGRYSDEEILAEAMQTFANSAVATDFTILTV